MVPVPPLLHNSQIASETVFAHVRLSSVAPALDLNEIGDWVVGNQQLAALLLGTAVGASAAAYFLFSVIKERIRRKSPAVVGSEPPQKISEASGRAATMRAQAIQPAISPLDLEWIEELYEDHRRNPDDLDVSYYFDPDGGAAASILNADFSHLKKIHLEPLSVMSDATEKALRKKFGRRIAITHLRK